MPEMGKLMEIEAQDRRILNILQRKGRISNQELADAVNMSSSACWRRVRMLEENGVIKGYGAIIDVNAAGLEFHAILHVMLTRHKPENQRNFVSAVQSRPEVLGCYQTTGDADYHLIIRCHNKEDYNRFLDDTLFRLPGVANVRTNLVLKEIKHQIGVQLEA